MGRWSRCARAGRTSDTPRWTSPCWGRDTVARARFAVHREGHEGRMRVVVTGATGNVGTSLIARFAQEPEIEVVGLARRVPAVDSSSPPVVACDVRRDDLVAQFRGADV